MNKDDWSNPIENLVLGSASGKKYLNEANYVDWTIKFSGKSPVQFHKEKLGRQSYCYQGDYRLWVWELTPKSRVYISNHKGIVFEVAKEVEKEEALELWSSYLKQIDADGKPIYDLFKVPF